MVRQEFAQPNPQPSSDSASSRDAANVDGDEEKFGQDHLGQGGISNVVTPRIVTA
jgi:hypothetical protein